MWLLFLFTVTSAWSVNVDLDKNRPSVYLSFVSAAAVDEDCSLKKVAAYRLALHNNTSRPINVQATYSANEPTTKLRLLDGSVVDSLPDGKLVRLCYEVETVPSFTSKVENGRIQMEIPVRPAAPEVIFYCTCAFEQQRDRRNDYQGVWVAPGNTIQFAVPQEYLKGQLKIYTLFNYESEFEGGKLRANEPHHQVYFYASDVPRAK
jgi:hypothetical protein